MAKRQHRSHDQRAAKKARTARHGLSQYKSDGQRAAHMPQVDGSQKSKDSSTGPQVSQRASAKRQPNKSCRRAIGQRQDRSHDQRPAKETSKW